MSSSKKDSLHTLRTRFQTGDYQYILDAHTKNQFPEEPKDELSFLLYRSMINLGKAEEVLAELPKTDDLPPHLVSARYLASYYVSSASQEDRSAVVASMQQNKDVPQYSQSLYFHIAYSVILMNEERFEDALSYLYSAPTESLENLSLQISCLVSMNLVKKAETTLSNMMTINPDATLTLLAQAYIHFANGQFAEASQIYEELAEKVGPTPYLQTLRGILKLTENDFTSANQFLTQSINMQEYNPLALSSLITLLSRSSFGSQESVLQRLRLKMISDYPFFPHARRLQTLQKALGSTDSS